MTKLKGLLTVACFLVTLILLGGLATNVWIKNGRLISEKKAAYVDLTQYFARDAYLSPELLGTAEGVVQEFDKQFRAAVDKSREDGHPGALRLLLARMKGENPSPPKAKCMLAP